MDTYYIYPDNEMGDFLVRITRATGLVTIAPSRFENTSDARAWIEETKKSECLKETSRETRANISSPD